MYIPSPPKNHHHTVQVASIRSNFWRTQAGRPHLDRWRSQQLSMIVYSGKWNVVCKSRAFALQPQAFRTGIQQNGRYSFIGAISSVMLSKVPSLWKAVIMNRYRFFHWKTFLLLQPAQHCFPFWGLSSKVPLPFCMMEACFRRLPLVRCKCDCLCTGTMRSSKPKWHLASSMAMLYLFGNVHYIVL